MTPNMCNLNVLTLNCWAIPLPFVTQKRRDRIDAISKALSSEQYDIVVLQEVWDKRDFSRIVNATASVLPYSHYFESGVIGSGVCILTRYPIVETFFSRYSVNGHPYKVQHGDWFGGKLVGLCRLQLPEITVNLYATHIHAEYQRENDEYLAHRLTQAMELSQFIKLTKGTADVSILAGDLNLEPVDLGFRIIQHNAQLKDSWMMQKCKLTDDVDEGHTCSIGSNSFSPRDSISKRIDYILYDSKAAYTVTCDSCTVTMGRIPDTDFNYSDHDAVLAQFSVQPNKESSACSDATDNNARLTQEDWAEASLVLKEGLVKIGERQRNILFLFFMFLCLRCVMIYNEFPYGTQVLIAISKFLVTCVMGGCLWYYFIVSRSETSSLRAMQQMINILQDPKRKQHEANENSAPEIIGETDKKST